MSGFWSKAGSVALCFCYAVIALLFFAGLQLASGLMLAYLGVDLYENDGAFTVTYCVIIITFGFIVSKLLTLFGSKNIIETRKQQWEPLCSVLMAFGLLGLVTLFMVLVGYLAEAGVGNTQEELERYNESVDRYAGVEVSVIPIADHILGLIGSAFLVPLAEEITFRGFIMGFFKKTVKPVWAILLSSLIFGVVHGTIIQIIYAFVCGVVLACVYQMTGSIWNSYLMHMVFNLFGGSLRTFFESGLISFPDGFLDNFDYVSYMAEIMFIGPAVGAAMILYKMYRKRIADESA
ncbi:MAG: CPBP family intramembrane metalloprotease [Clostridiales bacterium]|nr:CPBP family intramembrane metalloprotease [Clostridiales bacterium]